MTYYTTKCPHCGAYIKVMSSRKYSHGNPFKVCNRCKQTYVDPYCYEDAFKPYKKSGKFSYVIASLFGGLIVTLPVFAVVAYFSNYPIKTVGIASGVLFFISFILFLRHSLSNYEVTEAQFLREWQESDRRLKNPDYVKALVKAGFDVPEKYKAGIVFEKVDQYKPDPNKFICSNCGTYSAGWHQTCPKCGATGKMEKTTDYIKKYGKTKHDEELAKQENKKANEIMSSDGWKCPKCGKAHNGYESSCSCGASKFDKPAERSLNDTDKKESVEPLVEEKKSNDFTPKEDKSLSVQLVELKSLKDAGIITQEEFDAKKKQILGL